MSARKPWTIVAVVGVALAALSGVGFAVLRGDSTDRLAGADLLAEGGSARPGDVRSRRAANATLEDLPISGATRLAASQDRELLVLVELPGEQGRPPDQGLVRSSPDGRVVDVGFTVLELGNTALDIAPDGTVALAMGESILVRDFDEWEPVEGLDDVEARFPVGAIDLTTEGSLLLGSQDGARIDAVTPDGVIQPLLGGADEQAEFQVEESLGPIVSVQQLPDGRVVFVADTTDGYRLFLLDGAGEGRPVEIGQSAPLRALVDGPTETVGSGGDRIATTRLGRYAVQPVTVGPDGQLIIIGQTAGGTPQIALLDVDSGEVDVLADLEGVEVSDARPIAAAAVGDDLIFLAEGKLWRLDNAFR